MANIYLITGEPRSGKTSVIKRVVERIGGEYCGGFYTEEIHDANEAQDTRMGFRLVTLDGQSGILAHVMLESSLRMGRYGVNLECLQAIGLAAIDRALAAKKLVIVDELGPMQACSEPFKMKLMDILQQAHLLLGTIAWESHPWLDMIKQQKNVKLFEMASNNKTDITDDIMSTLCFDMK